MNDFAEDGTAAAGGVTVVECKCQCHTTGAIHIAPCCQGQCLVCHKWFSSGRAEHESVCKSPQYAASPVEDGTLDGDGRVIDNSSDPPAVNHQAAKVSFRGCD